MVDLSEMFESLKKSIFPSDIEEIQNDTKEETEAEHTYYQPKSDDIYGTCTLQIQFQNHGEYLKWKKYNGGRQWEFVTTYPAIMRAEYDFHTVQDIDILVRKIVQLLQIGFNVRASNWIIKPTKSQIDLEKEKHI